METSEIRIFESISLLSKLMPYYGSSHIGFLLLSLLSKSIRDYLLEHYPEYRTFMFKYAKRIDGERDKHLIMKLPLDLFQFSALNIDYNFEKDSEKDYEEDTKFLVGLIRTLFKLNYLSR